MKRKPWSLIILALLHILSPIGSFVVNALNAGRSLSEQWYYWFHVIPGYLTAFYIAAPILAGVLIYICHRWSYWAYIVCIALTLFSNIYSYSTNMTVPTLFLLIGIALLDIFVVAYFMVPSVQKVYFDPRLRWWEAAPRYHFNNEGIVNGSKANLTSLSIGGLFMNLNATLDIGDKVDIHWKFNEKETNISGIVLYKTSNQANPGYGVRFDHTHDTTKAVTEVIKDLHAKKQIIVERMPGPEDSFGVWFKKLITTGEGLFPKVRT